MVLSLFFMLSCLLILAIKMISSQIFLSSCDALQCLFITAAGETAICYFRTASNLQNETWETAARKTVSGATKDGKTDGGKRSLPQLPQ